MLHGARVAHLLQHGYAAAYGHSFCMLYCVERHVDTSINKPFKDSLREQYLTWIADPARKLTDKGKIKRAAHSEVAGWVSAAWKSIPESIIVRSFKKCCISNALGGSEGDIVLEDDGEDEDDSDWVMDNDSFISDDRESDE
jgi:hypothetical protein